MGEVIVTRVQDYWFDEEHGINRSRLKPGAKQTLQDAKEGIAVLMKMNAGPPRPLLVDLTGSLGLDHEARLYYGGPEGRASYSALALVGSTPVSRMLANMFFAVQRNKEAPTRFFATVAEAIDWLKQFVREENR